MREFYRDANLRYLVSNFSKNEEYNGRVRSAASLLLASETDNRGTIASLSKEVDEHLQELGESTFAYT